jgi:hypothetical protein
MDICILHQDSGTEDRIILSQGRSLKKCGELNYIYDPFPLVQVLIVSLGILGFEIGEYWKISSSFVF